MHKANSLSSRIIGSMRDKERKVGKLPFPLEAKQHSFRLDHDRPNNLLRELLSTERGLWEGIPSSLPLQRRTSKVTNGLCHRGERGDLMYACGRSSYRH